MLLLSEHLNQNITKCLYPLTDEKKKTTEIAEGIDILKATGCLKNAWKPVSEKTRQKLF